MIALITSENSDYDLTTAIAVLTNTPDASNPLLCQALIMIGDGAKDLDGSGGLFELTVTVGSQVAQPNPQEILFSTDIRAGLWTKPIAVPANTQIEIKLESPNAADTDVDVTVKLYDIAKGTTGGGTKETYTVTDADTGNPLDGAHVWVSTDAGGANVIWDAYTNAAGEAYYYHYLASGTVLYLWRELAGYRFDNPDIENST